MFSFSRRLAVFFFACMLVAEPFSFAASAAQGPEASIDLLQKAVETRDLALAEQYLDIDGVAEQVVDALLTEKAAAKSLKGKTLALGLALAVSGGANTAAVLKDLLQGEAREYVRHGVISGAFSGNLVKGASTYGGLFKKAFRGKGKEKITFGPARVVKWENGSALVATTLAQGTKGRSYPLELRLERRDGVWRVMELANVLDLVQKSIKKDSK